MQGVQAALSYTQQEGIMQLFATAKCDVNEALYEADKVLEKFAAALHECACLQDGGRSRR